MRLSFSLLVTTYVIYQIVSENSPFIQRSLLLVNHVDTQYGFSLSPPKKSDFKGNRLSRLHDESLGNAIANHPCSAPLRIIRFF